MPEPAAEKSSVPVRVSNAPVVLRIILAALLALPGLAGLAVFIGIAGEWLNDGMTIRENDRWIMPLFIVGAQSFICFSVLTIGIVLRFARWKHAPVASLVLGIVSIVVIVVGYQMLLDCFAVDDTDDRQLSLIFSVLGLIVVSLPPCLHWWFATQGAGSKPKAP